MSILKPTATGLEVTGNSTLDVTVNLNATAPTDDITGTVLRGVGVDSVTSIALLDSFASADSVVLRRANGTNATKTNLTAGSAIGSFAGRGYGATAYSGTRASMLYRAPTDWTDVSQPTTIEFLVTPRGTVATAMALKINDIGIHSYVAGSAVASAASITPTGPIFHVTGVAAIGTIVAPLDSLQMSQITIIPDGIFTWTTAGNIALAGTAVVNKAIIFTYDSTSTKWYPSYV